MERQGGAAGQAGEGVWIQVNPSGQEETVQPEVVCRHSTVPISTFCSILTFALGVFESYLRKILLPIGKAPRRRREHSQSISQ